MIRIDTYYDVTCSRCARSRSTDFGGYGWGMETTKNEFRKIVYKNGWRYIKLTNETLCPECYQNYKNND